MNYNTLKIDMLPEGILDITLNRPHKMNALSSQLLDELNNVLMMSKTSPDVKALLIRGEDKTFSAGADISEILPLSAQQGTEFSQYGQHVFRLLEQLGKPSLAAINGYALGGGCELALATTIRIASSEAILGQPEIKLGILPAYGGTQRLARLIGKGRTLYLCLTGCTISAQIALEWGLISEIVEPKNLYARAKEILVNLINMPPLAIRSIMQVIDTGYNLSLEEALHLETIHFGLNCATQDKIEGIKAFQEKRTPEFKGE
ncbi:MAG: Short-chain-enoyl-CoA hydratase [Legionellaceae bacterium]